MYIDNDQLILTTINTIFVSMSEHLKITPDSTSDSILSRLAF